MVSEATDVGTSARFESTILQRANYYCASTSCDLDGNWHFILKHVRLLSLL